MFGTVREANAIVTIAYRDILKFARDPARLIATLVLPVLFIGLFGEGLQATLGSSLGYNYLTFVFLGVFAQTLFQSTALGIVSLIEDRENDFAQEMFISPISRYAVDLTRAVYYLGQPAAYNKVVLASPFINLLIMIGMFVIFLVIGTTIFVRSERNK